MSVDYLSTLNVGSGLNTTEIIDALVDAERAPAESQITKKREQRNIEISGLGQVKQGFEALNAGLTPATGLTGLVASSTSTAFDIEIEDMSKASAFSHNVIVDSVAAGQTLVFDSHSGETASVGTGSLTLSFGKWESDGSFTANSDRSDVTVNIDSSSGTLAGLRDAINAADADVTASILKTSDSTYALVLKSREGANHAMKITASEDAGAAGLADFAYGAVDSNVQTIAASDASLRLDGTTITRDTNSISDLLDGMKMTLKSTSSTTGLVSARYDTATATAAMQLVVDGLNGMNEMLNTMSKRGVGGEEDGPLAGDPLVRSLQRQLRGYTTTSLTGFQDDPIHLADFGVKTARDGTISLDQEVFRRTFEANPDSFAAITNSRITSSSGLVSAAILGTQPADGVYTFDLADDGSATINGDAMTRDGSDYSLASGDAAGLKLSITGNGADAKIYVGTSLIEKIGNFATDVLALNSDLGQKITRYNEDLSDYDAELSALDTRIESIRARYVARFAAMESAVTSLKETGKSLDNMMDAWRASLDG